MSDPIGRVAAVAAQRFQNAAALQQGGGIGDRGALVPFGPVAEGTSFGDTLTKAINEVSAAQERSAALTGAFMRGEQVELHQVMAASEEAGISLEMMVEVRNKFTEAYRTLINMQS
jgi:flagellar hook-basal body complex protein FliE